jgi:vacuolar protein sorting-associated protein 1
VDKALKLTVYSYECPDLTLIDLPGITKISIGNQGLDIEKVTIEMAKRYCAEERTIILCVIPANADMATSQGLDLARKWDPEGHRTLGVITKIDIMDRGTDASAMIMNREIPLKLGYVGIKNRSQEDINNKVKVSEALNKEDEYFKNHQVYRNLDSKYVGTRSLTKRLTEVLEKNINKHLRSILNEVNEKAKECEAVIKSLG